VAELVDAVDLKSIDR